MGPALHFWDEEWLPSIFYFIMSPTLLPHLLWGQGMGREGGTWGLADDTQGQAPGLGNMELILSLSVNKHCSPPFGRIINYGDFCLDDKVPTGTQLIRPGLLTSLSVLVGRPFREVQTE